MGIARSTRNSMNVVLTLRELQLKIKEEEVLSIRCKLDVQCSFTSNSLHVHFSVGHRQTISCIQEVRTWKKSAFTEHS